jgi:ATP-dependent helicase/nuclease subunit A
VERHGVTEELTRLTEEKFLSRETAEAVRIDELERFFKSRFYQNLASATDVHRETRFNIFLPAEKFTESEDFAKELEGEKLLVQGVIDLFYTDADGKLVLCDYKTDRLSPAELRNPLWAAQKLSARHGEQLAYYAKALEEICGRAPDRILIYSLPLGEAVEVKISQ